MAGRMLENQMKNLKDTLHSTGYDPEELYFYRVNQELIQKFKSKSTKDNVIDMKEARAKREMEQANESTSTAIKKAA